MSADVLREAASAIRADHSLWHDLPDNCDDPACENNRFMHAVANWLDYEAQGRGNHPAALQVARAYLGETA